jgi:hypothetical protein
MSFASDGSVAGTLSSSRETPIVRASCSTASLYDTAGTLLQSLLLISLKR